MIKRNPKQADTPFFDCIPQKGRCPVGCNQCFFNRPNAYYVPIEELPLVPTPEEVGDGLVRMNCGNDSNNQRELVIATASHYDRVFFNTSINKLDFPGPVVLTANPSEEDEHRASMPEWHRERWYSPHLNLMFVRIRVSATNLELVDRLVRAWTGAGVPCVLTYMAYYDYQPEVPDYVRRSVGEDCYVWKQRHVNDYWCATPAFMAWVLRRYSSNRSVSMCGSLTDGYCRSCRNCETYYIQTEKRLRGE